MGDAHCSKIAVMQLFYELKQQFPTLPDHIISQCIAQNSYDRQSCEQSLQETQDRPQLGKFPPVLNAMSVRGIAYENSIQSEEQVLRPYRLVPVDIQKVVHYKTPISSNSGFSELTPTTDSNQDKNKRNSTVETVLHSTVNKSNESEYSRSYTSVSLTLRPPSSEPQIPIEFCSQGSTLTYTTSPSDPHGFQSHLQISVGPSNPASITAARIKHPINLTRPTSLMPLVQNIPSQMSDISEPTNQLVPAKTMSAPNTPSNPSKLTIVNSGSLPTTPTTCSESNSAITSAIQSQLHISSETGLNSLANKTYQKQLIAKQLSRKNKLIQALQAEKDKLEIMKQEINNLSEAKSSHLKSVDTKQKLWNNIYRLQLECDHLTKEIDKRSEQTVPLGETNEEFYRSIYTGQKIKRSNSTRVPPIPTEPPVWQSSDSSVVSSPSPDVSNDKEERLEPSWICSMCTFANHPLINTCEQCNMPQFNHVNKPGMRFNIHGDFQLNTESLMYNNNISIPKSCLIQKKNNQ